ncbi:uncharacterized protein LOC111244821 isoform X2 [Varroa destructor]|uniref:Uncharacterized protein n=1 Tax=Varroa destructor TaxID=109461 RepID=A0A7M7J7Q7_VARDE|nr:uncharacterized protein LOC111244821 isoform X2 [Varroa destructor]
MELLGCLVPLYVMHRLVPFACGACVGLACYVLARRLAVRPPRARLTWAVTRLLRAARFRGTNESFSRAELCPVASAYHNAEPHMPLLTPELHSEVAGVVDSILQGFILPWYSPLSESEEFPRHIEGILEDTFLELSHKLALIHPSRALQVSLEILCCHIQQLPRCQQSSESLGADHPAAVDRRSEWLYLQSLATLALRLVEPGDILTAKAVHLLVLHIICRNVLLPLVDLISKPGIIYYIVVAVCTPNSIGEKEETGLSSPDATSTDIAVEAKGFGGVQEPSVNDVLNVIVPTSLSTRHSFSLPATSSLRHSHLRSHNSVDIERAVEADNFAYGSAVHKVRITKTESRSELNKGVYTVYCIEYQSQMGGPLYRTRRRFNEFINLQTSLRKLGRFDLSLRGVKGPSRWLANPFVNDKKNVINRKIYLQNYLIQLSGIPEVVRTVQFQLFMGVLGEPDNYFTGGLATATSSLLRIDHMLAEGVRGALDLIKTALPGNVSLNKEINDDPHVANAIYRSNIWEQQPVQHQPPPSSFVEFKYDRDTSSRRLRQAVLNYIDSFDLASSPEFSPVHCGGVSPMTPIFPQAATRSEFDEGCQLTDTCHNATTAVDGLQSLLPGGLQQLSDQLQLRLTFSQGRQGPSSVSGAESLGRPRTTSPASPRCNPLIGALLDLITVILEGSGHGASRVPVLLSRLQGLIGSLAEEWLSDKLEETFAPHNCATMLHKLHLVISGLAQGGDISPVERSQDEARQALRSLMPPWALAYLPVIDQLIDGVLEALSQERFNRALVYKLADALLDLLASVDSIEEWTAGHR